MLELMSTIETSHVVGRGRPREFDEGAALDALTLLFWDKGYEATSMADIVRATGVNRSSLYNAFGSKHDLFRTVLSRYVEQRMTALAEYAEADPDGGIRSLHQFLDEMREFGRVGCLAVNTSAELGSADPAVQRLAQDYRDRTRASLHKLIDTVTRKSSLEVALVDARTDLLLGFLLGFAVAVRGGANDEEADRLISAAHAIVESWAS